MAADPMAASPLGINDLYPGLLGMILCHLGDTRTVLRQCATVSSRFYTATAAVHEVVVKDLHEEDHIQGALAYLRRCRSLWQGGVLRLTLRNMDFLSFAEVDSANTPSLPLRSLRCEDVVVTSLSFLLARCPSLAHLGLIRCADISDDDVAGVAHVTQGAGALTSLHLSALPKVHDVGLQALAQASTNLSELHITSCSGISDAGISVLLAACKSLHSLDLTSCSRITEATATAVVANRAPLVHLGLPPKAADATLAAIQHGAQAEDGLGFTLRSLRLRQSSASASSMVAVAGALPGLRTLDLAWCKQVKDRACEQLAVAAPRLTSLILDKTNVSDVGAAALLRGCEHLRTLSLRSTAATPASRAEALRLPRSVDCGADGPGVAADGGPGGEMTLDAAEALCAVVLDD
ncbi:fbxl-1 [Symbiodinium sp. KB8]|nr:fbxl-1 [Symbiodinium sp. KB8]